MRSIDVHVCEDLHECISVLQNCDGFAMCEKVTMASLLSCTYNIYMSKLVLRCGFSEYLLLSYYWDQV